MPASFARLLSSTFSSPHRWLVQAGVLLFVVLAFISTIDRVQAADGKASPARPNIVLIMADDFGYECVGANGCTSYRTPHLDRLAKEGARFEHCYVQPLCTPTRVQLMTGQYNVRNYVSFGKLDERQTTFGHLFRDAGYATCIVGKWQLGQSFDLPKHFGFDDYCLWQLTRRPGRYKNAGLEIDGKQLNYKNGEYGPDVVNDYALDFIKRSKDRPFLLYYPLMLTHDPYNATPDSDDYATAPYEGQNDGKAGGGAGSKSGHFRDMVEYMDKLLGKLLAKLDSEGLRERTLVIFIGDNGTGKGTPTEFAGRTVVGGKGTPDESGMRVPLIVGGPGVKPGTVCSDLVDSTDFLPTICAAAGIPLPTDTVIDGRSFLPQLGGEKGSPRDWIYCWYARNGGATAEAEFARGRTLKLYRDGRLFDVREGDFNRQPVDEKLLDAAGRAEIATLQAALDRYRDARPAQLGEKSGKGEKKAAAKAKKKA
jgi:arylsulfatase A